MKQDCTCIQGHPVLGLDINGELANVLLEDTPCYSRKADPRFKQGAMNISYGPDLPHKHPPMYIKTMCKALKIVQKKKKKRVRECLPTVKGHRFSNYQRPSVLPSEQRKNNK